MTSARPRRRLVGLVDRAGFVVRSAQQALRVADGRRALGLWAASLRSGVRLRDVAVPGSSDVIRLRVGRSQHDLATFVHVFIERCYELSPDQSPEVIVDCGAHAGFASVWFARTFPDARVIAIEMDGENVTLLRHNVRALPNVEVLHAAVADTDGELTVVDPGHGSWGFRAWGGSEQRVDTHAGDRGSVRAVTMDTVMAQHHLDRIDVLKLDIEGSEIEVLGAAGRWLDRTHTIIAELHDRLRPGCLRVFVSATAEFPHLSQSGENIRASRAAG